MTEKRSLSRIRALRSITRDGGNTGCEEQAWYRMTLNPTVPLATLLPPEPASCEETGLETSFLLDLLLKLLYTQGALPAYVLVEQLCLPYPHVVERVLSQAKREELVEVTGTNGLGELGYRYSLTSQGTRRAREALERNGYIGPAPVPFTAYLEVVREQSLQRLRVQRDALLAALGGLHFEQSLLEQLGQALNSAHAIFLYGKPGNGKTALAQRFAAMFGGTVLIPHAIIIDQQIIRIFDPHVHHAIELPRRTIGDRRWVRCERPSVLVGGELTLDAFDLKPSSQPGVMEAPIHLRANNGVFIIDDFGRQAFQPQALLNRWIIPLEERRDFLTLRNGKQIEVPWDGLLVLSTNLSPSALADEAFLRRIPAKIALGNPSVQQFAKIFEDQCRAFGIPFDPAGLAYLLRTHYVGKRELRACHPRDILRNLVGAAQFLGIEPRLTPALIDRACQTYFVDHAR